MLGLIDTAFHFAANKFTKGYKCYDKTTLRYCLPEQFLHYFNHWYNVLL